MALGLIATAVAIVRASSLGIKTADLSYDYCLAAIWANTELHLGIIATNLALSRMIWGCFVNEATSLVSNTQRYGTGTTHSKNRAGYLKSNDHSPYAKDDIDLRISLDGRSHASQIPLDPIIKRTTSVHISYKPAKDLERFEETHAGWK
jgi:hypothetical protein